MALSDLNTRSRTFKAAVLVAAAAGTGGFAGATTDPTQQPVKRDQQPSIEELSRYGAAEDRVITQLNGVTVIQSDGPRQDWIAEYPAVRDLDADPRKWLSPDVGGDDEPTPPIKFPDTRPATRNGLVKAAEGVIDTTVMPERHGFQRTASAAADEVLSCQGTWAWVRGGSLIPPNDGKLILWDAPGAGYSVRRMFGIECLGDNQDFDFMESDAFKDSGFVQNYGRNVVTDSGMFFEG